MRRQTLTRSVQIAFLLVAGLAWYAVTATGSVSQLFLPSPSAVYAALAALVRTVQFWNAVRVTAATIAQAFLIAAVAGIAVGYLVTRSRLWQSAVEPLIAGLFTVPITLFFPMFILFFGIGTASKIAYGAVYAFFPVALNTIAAFRTVEGRYVQAARSMGLTRWGVLRHVLLPGAFPLLLNGLRIGFFICFASVLGGETLSSITGVGRSIALAAELMQPARMYAWIVFVILTVLVLNMLVASFEARYQRSGEGNRA